MVPPQLVSTSSATSTRVPRAAMPGTRSMAPAQASLAGVGVGSLSSTVTATSPVPTTALVVAIWKKYSPAGRARVRYTVG